MAEWPDAKESDSEANTSSWGSIPPHAKRMVVIVHSLLGCDNRRVDGVRMQIGTMHRGGPKGLSLGFFSDSGLRMRVPSLRGGPSISSSSANGILAGSPNV